jgi:hypothetical protein
VANLAAPYIDILGKQLTQRNKAHVDDLLPARLDVFDEVVDDAFDAGAGKDGHERRLGEGRDAAPEENGAENKNKKGFWKEGISIGKLYLQI